MKSANFDREVLFVVIRGSCVKEGGGRVDDEIVNSFTYVELNLF